MYEVKHSTKGEVREFNMEHYRDGIYAMKQRSDFEILVRERQVDYYFQPIFSARDGHVAAYEALMRPRLPGSELSPEGDGAGQRDGAAV